MATAYSDPNAMSCLNNICSLDPDDSILNDFLQMKTDSTTCICVRCGYKTATSRCSSCNEYLCDNCVKTHRNLRPTKDHCIYRLSGSPMLCSPPLNNHFSPERKTSCETHPNEAMQFFCETCSVFVCSACTTDQHRGHGFIYVQEALNNSRTNGRKLLLDFMNRAKAVKDGLAITEAMTEMFNKKTNAVIGKIQSSMTKFQVTVKERECELLTKVENIRKIKNQVLLKQKEGLTNALDHCTYITTNLFEALEAGSPFELLSANAHAMRALNQLSKNIQVGMLSQDCISFVEPHSGLSRAIASMGEINASSFEFTIVDGTVNNVHSLLAPISSSCKPFIDDVSNGQDPLNSVLGNNESSLLSDGDERSDSGYFSFRVAQDCAIGSPLSNSHLLRNRLTSWFPMPVSLTQRRQSTLVFGREGDGDGELCRPWGVCCDKDGSIIVADRSNNRIQVFNRDGIFLHKFGQHGSEPGQFDRPAGVAVNSLSRIVVADKDNHRIQIFTKLGEFIFTFGDKGSKNGQFNYPWDVDVSSDGRIVVSDTRNHRIQLFTSEGSFICKYGFENASGMWKHFDSPRGVCFTPNSTIVVTDFNNHRLVVIENDCTRARFLGAEGSGTKQFLRPQGIAVDSDGHLIIADSRNNRIQVFENHGNFLWQFGTAGQERGQLDRPSGVCITPEGRIVVVDFGNNRIQIF